MKRLVDTVAGVVHDIPIIIVFGSKSNGPQHMVLEVFKALGIGIGRAAYQPDCKVPDYNFMASRFPILAGHTVNRDWKKLRDMFPTAKFVLVMQDEGISDDEDKQYWAAVQEYYSDRLLSISIIDANIPHSLMNFINLPHYLETLTIETLQKVHTITFSERVKRFIHARAKWIKAGKPTRTLDEVRKLYDEKCSVCLQFNSDSCNVCGCRIKRNTLLLNKLAWATESCALPIPEWEAQVKVSNSDLDMSEIEKMAKAELAKQVPDALPEGGRCCGG